MGENRGAYRVLVGKPEEKRPLGRSRRKEEHNIKVYFPENIAVRMGMDRIHLAQDTDKRRCLVNM
jgi:hypothetical protein